MPTLHTSKERALHATEILKVISDPTRYTILQLLFSRKQELCVKEIAAYVDMSHSATSHQLARLEDKNIVSSHREGQTICYMATNTPLTRTLRRIIANLNTLSL